MQRRDCRTLALLAVGAALFVATGPAGAAPPPPPGGHHAVFYGGDNTAGYPQVAISDAGDDGAASIPSRLQVSCTPNPFAGRTLLQFAARQGEALRVRIFTTAGRLVRELVQPAAARAGRQEIAWDGRDAAGILQSSGVYYYKLEAGSRSASGRLVFIR